jgi:sugar lactone lactonase YvrE
MRAELLFESQATLGESPVWDEHKQILYWLDILEKRIYAGPELLLQLDDFAGCLAVREAGGLVLALSSRIVAWEPSSKELTVLATVGEPSSNRFNDGKCDGAGRFLAGTMDRFEKEASGSLYSLEGREVRRLLDGIRISNGLAWSSDCKTLYYIDTPRRDVQAFDYDPASGEIANGRVAFSVPPGLGWPDGMTSDLDGNVWIAMWGGAQVTCWDPRAGHLLERIPVPALNTSSCAFGGPESNELYVTSARTGLSPSDLSQYPLSGSVFKVATKVAGMPAFEFSA